MTLPNLGDRVAFQTTTGPITGTVTGYGWIQDDADDLGEITSHPTVLVHLDRTYRGELCPFEWPHPERVPTVTITVIACNPELLEALEFPTAYGRPANPGETEYDYLERITVENHATESAGPGSLARE